MFASIKRLDNVNIDKKSMIFSLFIIYFIFSFIFNEDINVKLFSILLTLSFIFIFVKNKKVEVFMPLLIVSSIGFFTVALGYYIFDRLDLIPKGGPLSTYRRMVGLYVLLIPLAFLPTVLDHIHYKVNYLFKVVCLGVLFLGLYIFYYNLKFNFHRGELTIFFNPIASYDISFIAVSLLSLFYGFYNKSKYSYFIIILSLFSLFNLILHGSRGAWVALPIIFLVLIYSYFRTEKKKIALMLGSVFIFMLINLLNTNSPIMSRIGHFQSDQQNIIQNKYENSTGIRILLWKNAIEMFEQAPVMGVSLYGVEAENCRRAEVSKIPECYQHAHNIFLNELAANGIIGFVGLLISLFLPLFYFIFTFIRTHHEQLKFLGLAGFAFVLQYILSGLTEYYLFFRNPTFIYYFIVAMLMSFIYLQQRNLSNFCCMVDKNHSMASK
ncbi:O-antigen ligase family protein [Acinetobacter rudis]|uniref:O-antigen ligase family protein n=1 Tax=Acinetobacter rudis TaxID=632955 RepID=UPI00281095C3|nr:O-antigen ligase family protein [Acinetobacter rudis]MDQ8954168.1 O-antigen ligase family protein [Acinetobacter rudis]